jgi:tetratricopeptide (TPR) repeat protein
LVNLGKLFDLRGDHNLGRIALNRSRSLFAKRRNSQRAGMVSAVLADCSLRLGDLVKAGEWAEMASTLAAAERFEEDFIEAALAQGRVALGLGNLQRAEERLHHALTRSRSATLVRLELRALIAIAELELAQGHPFEARARLDEVWESSGHGPYRLLQADAYNVLADIVLAEGDKPAAIATATKAYRAAWCDGPPYAYHWGVTRAKAHLALGSAPEPDMPPFDESKSEPMLEVEINPKNKDWVDPNNLD